MSKRRNRIDKPKSQVELDRLSRRTWSINPVTRVKKDKRKNKKKGRQSIRKILREYKGE